MKKLLFTLLFLFVCAGYVYAISPTYTNPTAGTMNFYPMMQYQMEKQETLDFVNDSENYKEKRAKKDAEYEYRAGNKNFNPKYNNSTGLYNLNSSKNKEFTTDENGNIIIKNTIDK